MSILWRTLRRRSRCPTVPKQKLSLDRAFPLLAQLITQLECENCPEMHVITGNRRSVDSHTPPRVHFVQIEVKIDS